MSLRFLLLYIDSYTFSLLRLSLAEIMSLWEEDRDQFLQDLRAQRIDEELIGQFLQNKATSENVKRSCQSLQIDYNGKYGQVDVTGKAIPAKWTARIMDNIGRFVIIRGFAMKGAPETVGLVWFAVKQVLNAVQNNYKLYGFLRNGFD